MNKIKKKSEREHLLNKATVEEITQETQYMKGHWELFKKNKEWILSLLFVCSIVHSILQYGLFGINILEFYTLTDIFVNFAEVFVPFIILIPLLLLLSILPNGESTCSSVLIIIIKVSFFLFFSLMISLIYQSCFGFFSIFYFILLIVYLYRRNKKVLIWFFIFCLLFFSLGLPIEKRLSYRDNTALVDRLSFIYSEKTYDLSDIDHYYYIGGSLDYFFIYDKSIDSIRVIPKNECKQITRKPLYWKDLWNSKTYFNTKQRDNYKRRQIVVKKQ
ncbi:MAG: hypothetical protein J5671_01845 [Bacteroidaceae bacterium]|nr:hypothetical protein [Bacteroidaceae bacterium]